jgi:hypothetical protein
VIVNLWLGFDDRAQSTAKTPDADGNLHPAVRGLGDIITPDLFRIDSPAGPRTYQLWSVYGDVANDQEAVELRNSYLAYFPGQLRTVGGWWFDDGRMVGTENVYSTRIVTRTWSILNPAYQPNPDLPNFDDRYVLRVTGDVEEEYVSGHTGDPLFPLHVRILEFMPDLYDSEGVLIGRPTNLSDVNLGMGQAPRSFI